MPKTVIEPGADDRKIEELSFQLDDLTLAALACGTTKQPIILCLHGYLDNAASFIPLMKHTGILSHRRIIALEWPGHGHSEHRSRGAHYHFFDYVSDLVALFNHNDWSAIDIIAHSMGGMVASAFAASFPEKVKSLTLIDSLGFICAPAQQTTKQLRQGVLSRAKTLKTTRSFTEDMAVKARLSVSDLQSHHAKLIVQRSLTPATHEPAQHDNSTDVTQLFSWRSDPRLRTISPYRLTLAQGKQLLRDIECPVQLVYGDKGMDMVIKGLSLFSRYFADFIATEVSGGHHVHMEQTEQLCNLLNNFYRTNKIKTSV